MNFWVDQQSPLGQELPHLRHLWDSNPRGETPSAEQADALTARPKCQCCTKQESDSIGMLQPAEGLGFVSP